MPERESLKDTNSYKTGNKIKDKFSSSVFGDMFSGGRQETQKASLFKQPQSKISSMIRGTTAIGKDSNSIIEKFTTLLGKIEADRINQYKERMRFEREQETLRNTRHKEIIDVFLEASRGKRKAEKTLPKVKKPAETKLPAPVPVPLPRPAPPSVPTGPTPPATRPEPAKPAGPSAEEIARQQAEKVAREKAAREASERAAREASERAARETAERTAREASERAARETAERTAREARERATREAAERTTREASERAAREAAERTAREARERTAREAAARIARQQAAKESADRVAVGRGEQEAIRRAQDAERLTETRKRLEEAARSAERLRKDRRRTQEAPPSAPPVQQAPAATPAPTQPAPSATKVPSMPPAAAVGAIVGFGLTYSPQIAAVLQNEQGITSPQDIFAPAGKLKNIKLPKGGTSWDARKGEFNNDPEMPRLGAATPDVGAGNVRSTSYGLFGINNKRARNKKTKQIIPGSSTIDRFIKMFPNFELPDPGDPTNPEQVKKFNQAWWDLAKKNPVALAQAQLEFLEKRFKPAAERITDIRFKSDPGVQLFMLDRTVQLGPGFVAALNTPEAKNAKTPSEYIDAITKYDLENQRSYFLSTDDKMYKNIEVGIRNRFEKRRQQGKKLIGNTTIPAAPVDISSLGNTLNDMFLNNSDMKRSMASNQPGTGTMLLSNFTTNIASRSINLPPTQYNHPLMG